MTSQMKQEVNRKLKSSAAIGVLLRFEKGKVYVVNDHHKYFAATLDNAPKVLIGSAPAPKGFLMRGKYKYLIEPI